VRCHLLTLCMLGNFFKYFFLSKDAKNHCFLPINLLIYNLNFKQFGSQMKPHILCGFIWIQIVCIGYQRSSKFTASGLRVDSTLEWKVRLLIASSKLNSFRQSIPISYKVLFEIYVKSCLIIDIQTIQVKVVH